MLVHLVADTNLFFECKALDELPWRELDFDPIVILLTKPALDEIDKHKKASGRTRKRALEIFQRIRGMLVTSTTELVIRDSSPRVVLRRSAHTAPDTSLAGTLDYTRNDDRLIGIVAALNSETPVPKTVLFTDDTGPAAMADSLGLPFAMIPENWRRPAQESSEEKRIGELEKDLATYRSQEPKIYIGPCIPADETGTVTVTRRIAQPLTEVEIEEMLAILRLKHPLKEDFSSATTPLDESELNSGMTVRYEPPSDEDIKSYQDVLYPAWLNECQQILAELHVGRNELEERIILQWQMSNDGTRPASQVRVQFEAQGPLEIVRHLDEEDEQESDEPQFSVDPPKPKLPAPPRPPAPKRVVTRVLVTTKPTVVPAADLATLGSGRFLEEFNRMNAVARAAHALGNVDHLLSASKIFEQTGGMSHLLDQHRRMFEMPGMDATHRPQIDIPIIRPLIPPSHDPETFYYDDWPPMRPIKRGALTSDLWRHQDDEEVFEFEVLFTNDEEARGSILCTVHAENLTKPESSRVSIVRKVEAFRPLVLAQNMIEKCT